jgi:hypothetical protein
MAETKLVKECIILVDQIKKDLKNQKITIADAEKKLTQKGYWVQVDWSKCKKSMKEDISHAQMLIMSDSSLESGIYNKTIEQLDELISTEYRIYLCAVVMARWGYSILEIENN